MSYEPIKWARSQTIKGIPKSVLVSLSHFVNENRQCWPSYETLSLETGFSVKSVQRAVNFLEEKGFIKIERRQIKHTHVYIFPNSYPQANRSHSPVYKNKQVKSTTKQVTQSSQTGHSDLLTPMNYYKELEFNKNEHDQKMNITSSDFKTEPHLLRNLLKDIVGKKESNS